MGKTLIRNYSLSELGFYQSRNPVYLCTCVWLRYIYRCTCVWLAVAQCGVLSVERIRKMNVNCERDVFLNECQIPEKAKTVMLFTSSLVLFSILVSAYLTFYSRLPHAYRSWNGTLFVADLFFEQWTWHCLQTLILANFLWWFYGIQRYQDHCSPRLVSVVC